MLTPIEKIIFLLLALVSAGFTVHGFKTIIDSVRKGRPAPELKNVPASLVKAAITVLFQQTIFKARKVLSAIHMGLFFGLITYATYDLTNMATIRQWPLVVVVVDIAWGMVLTGAVSYLSWLAGMRFWA